MSDKHDSQQGSPVAIAIVAFCVLLVVYALSPGPIVWMLDRIGALPAYERWIEIAYFPLIVLIEAFPAVESFYDWYLGLFGVA
jgi:hypothetical protein